MGFRLQYCIDKAVRLYSIETVKHIKCQRLVPLEIFLNLKTKVCAVNLIFNLKPFVKPYYSFVSFSFPCVSLLHLLYYDISQFLYSVTFYQVVIKFSSTLGNFPIDLQYGFSPILTLFY
jgi:hypothetical protein